MRPFGPDNDVSFGVNGNVGNSYRRQNRLAYLDLSSAALPKKPIGG
jgi:hypothetical protein